MDLAEARRRVADHFLWAYRTTLDEVEIMDTPGYWQKKKPCGGWAGGCPSPLHGFEFNEKGIRHTLTFTEHGVRERGRWVSPYRAWRLIRDAELAAREHRTRRDFLAGFDPAEAAPENETRHWRTTRAA